MIAIMLDANHISERLASLKLEMSDLGGCECPLLES
jgi:hypothetical protein